MDGKPKIGIDVTSALSQRAGIGRYTRELVSALVNSVQTFEYLLFSAKQPSWDRLSSRIKESAQVSYRQAPLSEQWLYRIWHRFRIPVPVQRFTGEFDLFYSPDFVLPPVARGNPTVLTVHDLSFIHYPETFTPALRRYLNNAVPRSIHAAAHVLADSEATKNDLREIWGIPEEKISIIYSGVDPAFKPPSNSKNIANMKAKYKLGDKPYILSVSTVQPRKNYKMLIQAYKELVDEFPHQLVIAGGMGWLYEDTLNEVKRLGLEDRVRFLGYVDDEDLPALYSNATLFTFPSLYEGFGLPILEAMACGVPVIVSDASSLPEVAGGNGLILPPVEPRKWTHAMRELLNDPNRRAKMVAGGFIRVRQFSWKKAAGQLSAIFELLLP
ncbi:MAG: glycosyltransferase family 4 protein [Candidatus Promineifilaceae bacterium]|jgi:glycosyltransferase involved in cell wall biosynthesis